MESRDDPVKRSLSKRSDDRYTDVPDRKRSAVFDAPPPPRFDTSLVSSRKYVSKIRIVLMDINPNLSLAALVLMTRSMMIMAPRRPPSVDLMTIRAPSVLSIPQTNVANTAAPLVPSAVPSMNTLRCRVSALAMIMAQAPSMITRRPVPASAMITSATLRFATCQSHQVVLAPVARAAHMFTRATRAAVPAHMCTRTTLATLPPHTVTRATQVEELVVEVVATTMPTAATPLTTDVAASTTCHSE